MIKKIIPQSVKSFVRDELQLIKKRWRYRKLTHLYNTYKDYTMIPKESFLDNLDLALRYSNISGCVVECGVWRGGMSGALAELLGDKRKYYLFDSFEGLPPAKEIDGKKALQYQKDTDSPLYFDNCNAPIHYAEEAMKKSNVTKYKIIKGWFNKTLPKWSGEPIAILRLDSDWYESTTDCLENLYKYVRPGGLIIVDDYYNWDGCTRAVHDYLSKYKLSDRISRTNETKSAVCYIVKSQNTSQKNI